MAITMAMAMAMAMTATGWIDRYVQTIDRSNTNTNTTQELSKRNSQVVYQLLYYSLLVEIISSSQNV